MKPQPITGLITPKAASLVAIFMSMAAATASAEVIADIAGNYSGPSTLPANWGYFYSGQASGGTEVALEPDLPIGNGGNYGFGRVAPSIFYLPGVIGTQTAAQYEIFGDGDGNAAVLGSDLLLHPGPDAANNTVILRYTISAAEISSYGPSASIAGSFRDLITGGDSVTVSIYLNTTQVFTKTGSGGILTEANGTFDISGLSVAANDTISFVVNANTNIGADETALRGTIALNPAHVPSNIYWTGVSSSAWNTFAPNWKLASNHAPTEFLPGDAVFFHDNPDTEIVDISEGNVSPSSTTFDNTTATAYTLQGSNGIAMGDLTKSGGGLLTITNSNTTFGAVALSGGLTSITNGDGLGSGAITFDGGALEYTGATANWGGRDLTVNAGGGAVDVIDSGSTLSTTGILSGAGLLTKTGAGTLVLGQSTGSANTAIAISGGTLNLNCGAGAVTYSGNFTGSGGDLRLDGSGSVSLSGANDYTGTTTVAHGTLAVNNSSGSGTGSGAVTVQSSATLAGTGSISGSVSIESGGFVAPGNAGIGTLSVASAALTGTYQCQLDGAGCDQVLVSGELTINPGAVISISTLETPAAASYLIATYDSLVGSLPVVTGIPSGYVLDTATTGQIKLAPVPTDVKIIADIAGSYTGPSTLPANWGYFYSNQASGGTEVALAPDLPIGNGGNSGFGRDAPSIFYLPGVIGTQTAAQYEIFGDGDLNAPVLGTDLLIHPGPDAANNTVILRYTISAEEISSYGPSARIAGSFRELIPNGDSVTVSIYLNTTQLFTAIGSGGVLTEANGLFDISGIMVAANDTISFVVNANTNIGADETALRGSIALAPEPASSNIYWTGAASSYWNTLATNWKLISNAAPTQFRAYDAVFFRDNPTTAVVDISEGNVSPSSTTFDNTTATAYTLQGSNGIALGTLTKSGSGSLTIINSNSTFGAVALNGGLTTTTNGDGLGSGAITFDGGALEYTGATANWGPRDLTVNAGGGSVDVTDGGSTLSTTGILSGDGLFTKMGAGTLVLGQTTGSVSTAIAISGGTLNLNCGAGAVIYSGNFTGSGGDLRLDGSGTRTFTGANDYTGTTTVTQGTLVVDNSSGSGTGSGEVTVQSSATLAGTGSIGGSVSIESGGFVAPGSAGIGTLSVASAVLTGTYQCQLDGASCDQVLVSGDLTISPGAVISVSKLATPAAASYLIATYGSLVGSLPVVTGIPSGYVLDTATAGQIKLAPVPSNVTVIADLAGDYIDPTTLPADWGYFYSDQASGGTEVALTPDLAIGNGGNSGFGAPFSFNLPGVIGTQTGAQYEIFTDGDKNAPVLGTDLLLHPGPDAASHTLIVRYTISEAEISSYGSSAIIAGSFRELITSGNSVIVSIYQNSTELFTRTGSGGILTEADGTFDISGLTVAANDTISFVVNSNNNYAADETALRGSIALVGSADGFSTWADSFPGLTDKTPAGDPDKDGISNLLEYVIGGDPRVSSTSYLPTQKIVGSNLVMGYKRSDASEADTTQIGQWSSNLSVWHDLTPVQVNENDSAPDSMEIRIPLSNAVGGKLFGRLHVIKP